MASLLVTGGCRSGKSAFAQNWVEARGRRRLYLATSRVWDQEMADRVEKHRLVRGPNWRTVEAPLFPASALADLEDADAILLDCVTMWLTNMLMDKWADQEIEAAVDALAAVMEAPPRPLAVVTNEVGLGIVPEDPLSRRFRDLSGWAAQRLAGSANQVVLVAAGLPLTLKE